ncbi:MAG: RloB family protein [Candidatus Methanoperedens sp.]|nr:RloB family protein [Candidatus Methanoperedens sp.]
MIRPYGRRKEGTREIQRVFVIVSEGSDTEPIYFNRYKRRNCNLTIEVPNNKYTDPVGLVEWARYYIKRKELDLKGGDKIWCVFDCDSNKNKQLSEACKNAGKDIIICFSNPSFELWYLLHFDNIQSKIWREEVNVRLTKRIPGYTKTKDCYDLLEKYRPVAIENAKNLTKKLEKSGTELISVESNPSTQVYNIVEEILKITKDTD